jgi:beta-1,4-N-acetylglucosaminyltransferase
MQLVALQPAWEEFDVTWVTLAAADTKTMLANQDTVFAYGPTNRSLRKFARNCVLAIRVVMRRRPDVMLSTGAGLAVPFFLFGRLIGARLVYVESITRVHGPSLSGRLVYPLCHEFFVQWPEAATKPRMRFEGRLM